MDELSKQPKTLDEAAAFFRVSRRCFQDFLRDHPFYRTLGRRKLIFPEDLARLKEALSKPCLSASDLRAKGKRQTMKSGVPTSESTLNELRALLNFGSPSASSRASRKPLIFPR